MISFTRKAIRSACVLYWHIHNTIMGTPAPAKCILLEFFDIASSKCTQFSYARQIKWIIMYFWHSVYFFLFCRSEAQVLQALYAHNLSDLFCLMGTGQCVKEIMKSRRPSVQLFGLHKKYKCPFLRLSCVVARSVHLTFRGQFIWRSGINFHVRSTRKEFEMSMSLIST